MIEEELPVSFTVYPNPTQAAFMIKHNKIWEGNVKFALMDMTGKTVRSMDLSSDVSGQVINVSDLSAGIYFGIWRLNGEVLQGERIIIQP
ncbi:MAG: T9SS type A sorting domain-containing protein [Bacteroidia bacterium]